MSTFREKAEKIFISRFMPLDIHAAEVKEFLDALTTLHQKEIERIIGEDENRWYEPWDIPYRRQAEMNKLRAEQRRRAGLEEE